MGSYQLHTWSKGSTFTISPS